jgi:hypothetical protein
MHSSNPYRLHWCIPRRRRSFAAEFCECSISIELIFLPEQLSYSVWWNRGAKSSLSSLLILISFLITRWTLTNLKHADTGAQLFHLINDEHKWYHQLTDRQLYLIALSFNLYELCTKWDGLSHLFFQNAIMMSQIMSFSFVMLSLLLGLQLNVLNKRVLAVWYRPCCSALRPYSKDRRRRRSPNRNF